MKTILGIIGALCAVFVVLVVLCIQQSISVAATSAEIDTRITAHCAAQIEKEDRVFDELTEIKTDLKEVLKRIGGNTPLYQRR